MAHHIFHKSGYEPYTVLVEASTADEARGKVYDELPTGIQPEYQGTVRELLSKEDSDVLEMRDL